MSSNITNFKNIINQNFATIKRKFNNIENNYNSSTSPTTSNNQSISRNVGEIITSSLPLTDAGLHLLDGSLIQGDGINSEFVDYIANIYKISIPMQDDSINPDLYVLEFTEKSYDLNGHETYIELERK